jgi:hypothetical protein
MKVITASEYQKLCRPSRNKFDAKQTIVDGILFDSAAEARFYSHLKLRERAGEVYGVELQPVYPITMNSIVCATHRLDFRYWDQRFHGMSCAPTFLAKHQHRRMRHDPGGNSRSCCFRR